MKCIICNKEINGCGNNAMPYFNGKCCDKCNLFIIAERMNTEVIQNRSTNSRCNRCGECCTDFIPLTENEIKIIKNYMKVNTVIRTQHKDDYNNIVLLCPFYRDNKCQIYPVRPSICRGFNCCDSKEKIARNKIKCNGNAVVNNIYTIESLHSIFFGDKEYSDMLIQAIKEDKVKTI